MDRPEMETLIKNIDARTTVLEQIVPTLATKDDLKAFATKEDLQAFATKDDMREEGERTRRHFDVVAEDLKKSIAVIAEGHEVTKARVDGVRRELKADIAEHERRITQLEADASKRR
jgi:hypothetical protein